MYYDTQTNILKIRGLFLSKSMIMYKLKSIKTVQK